MGSDSLVRLTLKTLSCSQKELGARLGVSPTQISKWKKGEHMSEEMEEKLRAIADIGHLDPAFVLWAGSREEAIKWERLIHYLAELAQFDNETGYDAEPLEDNHGDLCWHTFHVLTEMGVAIPQEFPKELDIDYETIDGDEIWRLIDENPYSNLMDKIFKSLTNVYGFYSAYISELMFDDGLDLLDTAACNLEPGLMALAATKIEVPREFAPKASEFNYQTMSDYAKWLTLVKDRAFRAGIPLRAELLDLVNGDDDSLGVEAEAESLGFNSSRLHPDIYMNELLVGMRIVHQVLPAIMKQLGIDDEFKLDTSDLRIS